MQGRENGRARPCYLESRGRLLNATPKGLLSFPENHREKNQTEAVAQC